MLECMTKRILNDSRFPWPLWAAIEDDSKNSHFDHNEIYKSTENRCDGSLPISSRWNCDGKTFSSARNWLGSRQESPRKLLKSKKLLKSFWWTRVKFGPPLYFSVSNNWPREVHKGTYPSSIEQQSSMLIIWRWKRTMTLKASVHKSKPYDIYTPHTSRTQEGGPEEWAGSRGSRGRYCP